MYLLFYVFTIIHRLVLVSLLICSALVPLFIESNILTIYVGLPIVFILFSISTIYIENTLDKYKKQLNMNKKRMRPKKCLIEYGICCIHH
jgi:hypothetical protein